MTNYAVDNYDYNRFAMMAGHVRIVGETLLREYFGERCHEFDPNCANCERWKALDDLTENPFAPIVVERSE